MRDPRHERLAELIAGYSLDVQPGEIVHLELKGLDSIEMGRELVRAVTRRGGVPFWFWNDERFLRPFLEEASEAQVEAHGAFQAAMMDRTQAFVSVRGSDNAFELADVSGERMGWLSRHVWQPVHIERRVARTKWVVLRWPNHAMAQAAQRSQEAFEDFYFRVCTLDYAALSAAMDPLVVRLERTEQVRVVAPDTDLRMAIKGIPVVKCDGKRNIPDGEVYTAPVRDSVQGSIRFNAGTIHGGRPFDDIRLRFASGRVVEAHAADAAQTAALHRVLDTDEGARSLGEFALGVNPGISEPMRDILFDEKIAGSIHMALGNAYDSAPNGNRSAIHWDLVLIQTAARGGGELWFDDELVRKDGRFVVPDLEPLDRIELA